MQSRAAIRYAKAIYDVANEENSVNEVYKDMSLIKELYASSIDFKNLLSNSQINYQDKKRAVLSLTCLLYTSPSPRDMRRSRMPSSA